MPRTQPRKTVDKYSKEDLLKAISDVNTKTCNVLQASKKYGVPRTTIIKHTHGWKNCNPTMRIGAGRPTELPYREECTLALCLKKMTNWGFGLGRKEVMLVVRDYIVQNKIESRFKEGLPGEDWYLLFMKRHCLSLKKPEPKQDVRYLQVDPEVIYGFFELLASVIKELGLESKPGSVLNTDETNMYYDPVTTKVVGGKGEICSRRTAGSGRTNTTVLATVSASGEVFPPFVLYKAVNLWDKWMPEGAYPNTMYDVSDNGFMTEKTFFQYFKYQFLPNVPERPCVLIYDGHLSHVSIDIIKLAMQENVTLLKLPPHTTHLLQPLNVAGFKPLKTEWDKQLVQWQRQHYGQTFGKPQFAVLLGKVWSSLKPEHARAGFRKTGLFDPSLPFPVNPRAVDRSVFDQYKLNTYLISHSFHPCPESLPNLTITVENPGECTKPSTHFKPGVGSPDDAEPSSKPSSVLPEEPRPSTSSFETCLEEVPQPQATPGTEVLLPGETSSSSSSETRFSSNNDSSKSINSSVFGGSNNDIMNLVGTTSIPQELSPRKRAHSFEQILLQKIERSKNAEGKGSKKTKVSGEILTRESMLEKLQMKADKKLQKPVKKKGKQLKKKANVNLEGDCSSGKSISKLCDDNSSDESLQLSDIREVGENIPQNIRQFDVHFHKVCSQIVENKFYAIYYEENYFYGQVTKVFRHDLSKDSPISDIEIKFLDKKVGITNGYWWAKTPKVELISARHVFYGPVKVMDFNPFIITSDSFVSKLYKSVRANRDKIFQEIS